LQGDHSEHELAEHIRAERVRFVFIQSLLPIIFSPLAAAILSLALWNDVNHTLLVTWTGGLVAIALVRGLLIRQFSRLPPEQQDVKRWERVFVTSIMAVDLWWGIGALLLLPSTPAERALVFSFVMLMAGGHTASYSAHPATVTLGVLALTLPITVHFGLQRDTFHGAMAFVAVMYLAASFRSIKTLGYFFGRTHRLAHELEKLARIDFLTSLNNRRAFYEAGQNAVSAAGRYAHPTSLVMLDIDHFKSINDRFGHAAGDAALRQLADRMRETVRATDIDGRIGGEEFAIVLTETALGDAERIAERLRASVESSTGFTISAGVAQLEGDEALDQLMARADTALYRAKRDGRNRVSIAHAPGPAAAFESIAAKSKDSLSFRTASFFNDR
jgi:diguanylate cyclase (GGDEF)-like protein